jgi:small subunit ribosomal protein S13
VARIAGVDLPPSKKIEIGLTYIFGIGHTRSAEILGKAMVDGTVKVKDLTEEQILKIQRVINQEGRIEGDLRKAITLDIKRLIEIGSYRGMRHRPVQGSENAHQRSHAAGSEAGHYGQATQNRQEGLIPNGD